MSELEHGGSFAKIYRRWERTDGYLQVGHHVDRWIRHLAPDFGADDIAFGTAVP